jgi:hypothetical protein
MSAIGRRTFWDGPNLLLVLGSELYVSALAESSRIGLDSQGGAYEPENSTTTRSPHGEVIQKPQFDKTTGRARRDGQKPHLFAKIRAAIVVFEPETASGM